MRVRLLAMFLGIMLTLGIANVAFAQGGARHGRRGSSATTGAEGVASATTSDGGAGASTNAADAGALATGGDAAATTVAMPATTGATEMGSPDAGGMSGEQYVVRLRDLEQRINELKEEIFRSKARLSLLAESVLQNVVGGARALIQHENEMGQSFRLVRAVYAMDGAPILTRVDDNGSLADVHDFPVYNGQIGAGDHTLSVNMEYQGHGYGIFSYVKGYTFRVRSVSNFTVADGKAIQIRVVGYEKGGATTPPEERPNVRFIQRVMTLRDAAEMEQTRDEGQGNRPRQNGAANQNGAGNP